MPRLKASPKEILQYLASLETAPHRIAAATAGIDEAKLRTPDGRNWSVVDILAHLRACDELWTHSIYAMLTEDNPVLPLIDERRWTKVTGYRLLDFKSSFQAFTLKRTELLRVLHALPDDSWARTAVIEGRTHSVFSQTRRMALHEVEHCEQIELLFAANKLI